MHIVDITKLIKLNQKNYYCFNNCLQHIKDNLFIMVYRVIKYNPPDGKTYHPWQVWDNNYKVFAIKSKELFKQNQHLNVNKKLYNTSKYRKKLSNDKFIILDSEDLIDKNL